MVKASLGAMGQRRSFFCFVVYHMVCSRFVKSSRKTTHELTIKRQEKKFIYHFVCCLSICEIYIEKVTIYIFLFSFMLLLFSYCNEISLFRSHFLPKSSAPLYFCSAKNSSNTKNTLSVVSSSLASSLFYFFVIRT